MLPLFKVVGPDMRSIHGGDFVYEVGKWTPEIAVDKLSICERGYHLTSDPLVWWRPKARVFLAEFGASGGAQTDKGVFASVMLVGEITRKTPGLEAWPRLRCFLAATERSENAKSDIAWANLSRADLSGADLSGANLSGANLSRANLSGANLSGATMPNGETYKEEK
jgi:hypothetical protein